MKNTFVWGLVGLFAIIGAAVYIGASENRNPLVAAVGGLFQEDDTIRIGAALGLSGMCAAWGEGELNAVRLYFDETNAGGGIDGKQIELVVEDTQCDPKGSVNAMHKLIEVNKVDAIVGVTWGESFQAGHIVNDSKQIVAVTPSGGIDAIVRNNTPITYLFSTYFPYNAEADFLAAYADKTGVKKIAAIHDSDPYGATFAEQFVKSSRVRNISVVKDQDVPISFEDFRTLMQELKSLDLDGVFISFQAPMQQAIFLKQAKELSLNIKIFSPSDIQDPSLLEEFGSSLNDVLYAYPEPSGSYTEFEEKYKQRYGTVPSGPSAPSAYDAVRVVVAALKVQSETGQDLKTILEKIEIPGTVVKTIKFDEQHELSGFKYEIKTIRDGEFVVIE